jgi:hypothetical protein
MLQPLEIGLNFLAFGVSAGPSKDRPTSNVLFESWITV